MHISRGNERKSETERRSKGEIEASIHTHILVKLFPFNATTTTTTTTTFWHLNECEQKYNEKWRKITEITVCHIFSGFNLYPRHRMHCACRIIGNDWWTFVIFKLLKVHLTERIITFLYVYYNVVIVVVFYQFYRVFWLLMNKMRFSHDNNNNNKIE